MMLFRAIACTILLLIISSVALAIEPDRVFAKVSNSIVAVAAVTSTPDLISRGSGIIVGPGEIVTTCSTVRNATFIAVAKESFKAVARLRFADPLRGLCQLSVGKKNGFDDALTWNVTFSDLRVGQKVYAIGAPDGIELTLTDGIVSSIRPSRIGREIQTTAPVWSGSSGGGLFDSSGNLVGVINFDRTRDQELSIATSAHWVAELPSRVADLIKTKELRLKRERICSEQIERRLVESLWDDEPESILDPMCERIERRFEQARLAAEAGAERRRVEKEEAERHSAAQQQLVDDFKARISAKVHSRVVVPPDISGNPEALYEVVLLAGGDVLSVNLKKSSGFPAYDSAVRSAILAAQPLPVPSGDFFQNHFRRFNISFRPKD